MLAGEMTKCHVLDSSELLLRVGSCLFWMVASFFFVLLINLSVAQPDSEIPRVHMTYRPLTHASKKLQASWMRRNRPWLLCW